MEDEKYVVSKIAEVADFFSVSVAYIRKWLERGCPRIQAGKTRSRYDLREIHKWCRENIWTGSDEPNIESEVSSDGLERSRLAQAELKELELAEKKEMLVNRDLAHDSLIRLQVILQGLGDRLQKDYGTEAQTLLDEALDDFEKVVDDSFGYKEYAESSSE